MSKRLIWNGLGIIVVLGAAFGVGVWLGEPEPPEPTGDLLLWQDSAFSILAQPRLMPAIKLRDHNGRKFGLGQLRDRWTLLFFGFTSCPDVCPTTLAVLNKIHRRLKEKAAIDAAPQVVMVSVDPGRDTPQRLKDYVSFFNPEFLGVTGEPEEIDKLTQYLGATYELHKKTPWDSQYDVDHTAGVFVLDSRARYQAVFLSPPEVDAVVARYELIRQLDRNKGI